MTGVQENYAGTAVSGPTCNQCLFFREPEKPGPGNCRRRSPRAIQTRVDPREYRSVWPEVWGERDWCGEFSPLPGEEY
jgi:hypothetical protein